MLIRIAFYTKMDSDAKTEKKYTVHTIQNIAFLSKVLVASALCNAVDQGKIDLDESIGKYLPWKIRSFRRKTLRFVIYLRTLPPYRTTIIIYRSAIIYTLINDLRISFWFLILYRY
jgi:hypothetical protein